MTMELKNELIEKVKDVKSAEELLALAKANGIELTGEEAEKLFNSLGNELSDEALDGVSGGDALFDSLLLELLAHKKMLEDIVRWQMGCPINEDENLPEI